MLVTTAVVTLLLVNGLGPQFARDVWNPHITVLPFLLLGFLAWTMSCGDRWAAPVGAVVASFLVQTHVGYALPALVLAAGGFVGARVEHPPRRDGRRPHELRESRRRGRWWAPCSSRERCSR